MVKKCPHGRQKYQCVDCGGKGICEHRRERSKCKECRGSAICEHGRRRSICKECGGGSICEHGRVRSKCKDCGGGSICEHERIRSDCKDCGGGSICEHERIRSDCRDCFTHPQNFCALCNYSYIGSSPYKPYCSGCYAFLHPEEKLPSRYLKKERHLHEILETEFPEEKFAYNKSVGDSGKKPDWLLDLQSHIVVIECDENQHEGGHYGCEERRTMEIFRDKNSRPLVMIRFNPDRYVDEAGEVHSSCFSFTKENRFVVHEAELSRRVEILIWWVNWYLVNKPEKEVEIVPLFYDEN